MKILVTGASGTIGTRLCEILLQEGKDIAGVDRVPNKWLPAVNDITVQADLLQEDQLQNIPSDVDIIVHLAANARVYELVEHPERAMENLVTTFNTLEFARKNGIKKIIFASSREAYGNIAAESYTEDMVRVENCESPYTASKIAGEALVESYMRCYDIDFVTLRFSNVYGMYDDSVRVVPLFFRLSKAGEPMTIFGKEKCLDFTYIDDTVRGICSVIEKFDDVKNDVYNIAYGSGTTIMHLAERMRELTGSTSEILATDSRRGEITKYIANVSKARKALGYEPSIPFEEGILKTVEWYESHT
ncbi:nucleoside-diphosphate sugar epimerase [Candidatus Peregrinibacteria bacterium CG10_big_fil_rev_8_21_14_0_10_49_24]|nr:MAG: nucleoside-diphosphate sugar epimerase [Candidatus Peregrinibacteria bacterium CG11_big_fil_rev_8_21_14_0_20_49_14]PIR51523.1 MAG: nucleoside-diphosphate sugar epimerase [Candidatus Peregrinibacteria bacterium CG10_big_fil_rev_8_21_14_0_10_49_24]PJA67834.1 MAG: nucleoside-diphosphate sugar epimerase [Candidatus Peregrinibacteria bacterium CG_4_9_14_3_um_filter_49_12]